MNNMKKINIAELVIFGIAFCIELFIFSYGLIHQKSDEWHNTIFIFFTNFYVIYFGVIYFIDKFLKNKYDDNKN